VKNSEEVAKLKESIQKIQNEIENMKVNEEPKI
jgi:hypothetical protein